MANEGGLYSAEVRERAIGGKERQITDGTGSHPYGTTLEKILGDFCMCPTN